ncbi:MAG: BamA/TamA family outer membrane protein [Rhodothermales bacterium]|nr:BamA/TamA family outer membrane protein [Rhodothermales bacterium]
MPEDRPLVAHVRFTGNVAFPDAVLSARLRTAPNRRFLGVPGLTWWLWQYRLGASGRFGRRLGRALMATGEAPAYLDASVVAADAERLENLYRQEGFREARVQARIDTLSARRVDVTFAIDAGPPTYFRRVAYAGLDALGAEQRQRLARTSLLEPARVDPAAPLRFAVEGQRYSEPLLLAERRRLLTFLRNAGYAAVTRDSIRAVVTPARPDSFDVTIETRLGPRYRFGAVHFAVEGPEARATLRADTLAAAGPPVSWTIAGDRRLDPALLLRALQFRPGQWYDQARLLATKRRLEASGVFAFTDVASLPADTVRPGPGAPPLLPHRIGARTRPRHRLRFETFMVQRSGVLGVAASELGTGLGVSYENANLLGRGETFRLGTTGSVAFADPFDARPDSTWLNASEIDVTSALTLPYLVAPFQGLDRRLGLYQARTRLSLSLLAARRDELGLVIRGRGAARMRLELQHAPTVTSLLDLLDVTVSNPDTLAGFQERFLDRILIPGDSLDVTDRVQRAQLLEDYTQPQINNALRYTLRAARLNPLRREDGYSYEAAFEVGGNLPYLLDRFASSPDTVEGSLPPLPFFGGGRAGSRLVYRQYVRLVADLRQYRPVSRTTVLAWKVFGGFAHPTGRTSVVPFDRRFFSGGAASVRGWDLRTLGPGAARFDQAGEGLEANILGGDVKLEASLELRSTLLRNAFAADWILALFTDAGNVWFGPRNPGFRRPGGGPTGKFALDAFYREVGVGSGVGLRIAWEYLIVRLDLAYRVHDPAAPDAAPFREREWHFGLGHAF